MMLPCEIIRVYEFFLLFLIAFGTKSVETDRYKKRLPPDGMVLILMEYFIDQSRINETMKR